MKTPILAILIALGPSVAVAQQNTAPGVNLDPGLSGGTSGLISGGGTAAAPLDARAPSGTRGPVSSRQKMQSETNASVDADTRSRAKKAKAQAQTDAKAEADPDPRTQRPKRERSRPAYYPYGSISGFRLFGGR